MRQAIDYFRERKDEYDYTISTGNLYIHVHKYSGDEEYGVVISNDFYEMDIPFEPDDYE